MRRTSSPTIVVLACITLIMVLAPFSSIRTAKASASGAPTITVSNTGNSATLGISSSGPFNQDFQYVLCWNSSCTTSAWASDIAGTGNSNGNYYSQQYMSPWIWPGYKDGMGGGSLYIQSVNTRALPANEELDYVQISIELSEDNNGSLVGSNDALGCDNQVMAVTPLGGGNSGPAYGHIYGCSGNSDTPDVLRIGIGSEIVSASMTSTNIPSTMTTGQTITNAVISATNNSIMGYYANPIIFNDGANQQAVATSAVTWSSADGNNYCTSSDGLKDSNGNLVYDEPNAPDYGDGATSYCTVQESITAPDLIITHSGSFTTPQTVPLQMNISVANVEVSSDNVDPDPCGHEEDPSDGCGPYTIPASSYTENNPNPSIIPVCTQPNGYYCDYYASYGTQAPATFNLGTFTAPSTPGTYTETWTLSDSTYGNIPGGVFTKTIVVTDPNANNTVTLGDDRPNNDLLPTAWRIVANGAPTLTGSGSGQTYANVSSPNQYTVYDANNGNTGLYGFAPQSTSTGMKNPSSIFARVIKSAEAGTCAGWSCGLSSGGTVTFNATSTFCPITVNTTLNGSSTTALTNLGYSVLGFSNYLNQNTAQTIVANTPDSSNIIGPVADASGTLYTIAANPLVSSNGGLYDLTSVTPALSQTCSPNNGITYTLGYVGRASLNIH